MKNALKILLIADMWQVLAVGMIAPIYAVFVQKIGGNILDASWGYFAFMFSAGLVIYIISHWEDKVKHKEHLLILGFALTSLAFFMYLFVHTQMMLVASQLVLGLGNAVRTPAYDGLYSKFLSKSKEASGWGSWESMWYMTTAVASVIGGYIADIFGFHTLFIVMGICSALAVVCCLFLYKNNRFLNSEEL